MNKRVYEKLKELDPFNHGITIAIHQNENECIAIFICRDNLILKRWILLSGIKM